jgi:hypothetical protein
LEGDVGDVIEQHDRIVRYSIARLAGEFGMGRDTVAKRLAQANVRADGKRNGYPVYRLRDVCAVLLNFDAYGAGGILDPCTLPPIERRAWFQSENERLKVECDMGRLIPAAEVEAEMAQMARTVVRALETLPDTVERDLRAPPEVIEYLIDKVYELRRQLTCELAAAAGEGEEHAND